MVKIAISPEAFDAIAGAMPVESVGFAQTNERGERLIWLPRGVVAKLRAMRGRGESYSNVILRLAAVGCGGSVRLTRVCAPRQL